MRRALAAPLDIALGQVVAMLLAHHPGLRRQLSSLPPAAVWVVPTDLPVSLLVGIGPGGPSLRAVLAGERPPAATCVRAPLRRLVALAESRIDADTAFFNRDIEIDGDMEPILTVRNALENESLDIAGELLSALGPLATPARHAGAAFVAATQLAGILAGHARTALCGPGRPAGRP